MTTNLSSTTLKRLWRLQTAKERIESKIATLFGTNGTTKKRRMSKAARAAISKAQVKRWKLHHAKKAK